MALYVLYMRKDILDTPCSKHHNLTTDKRQEISVIAFTTENNIAHIENVKDNYTVTEDTMLVHVAESLVRCSSSTGHVLSNCTDILPHHCLQQH